MKNSIKIDSHPPFSFGPKIDLIASPESVSIFIKFCLRRRSGVFTHFTLQVAQTSRSAKHTLFDELLARMTHRETFLNWLRNRASGYFPIIFLLLQWQMHSWSFHQLDKLIRKGVPGLQGSLVVDSAWSWIPTQTFHRTSDGVAGRLAQEVQMVLLSVPICWECVWADSWFPTMLNCRSCCHWSSCAGKSDFPVWSECFPSDLNSQLHFSPKTAKYSWEHLTIPNSIETRSKLFRMMLSWLKHIFVHVTTPWPGIKAITLPEMTCATSHTFEI